MVGCGGVRVVVAPRWLPLGLIALATGALTVSGILFAVRQEYVKEHASLELR